MWNEFDIAAPANGCVSFEALRTAQLVWRQRFISASVCHFNDISVQELTDPQFTVWERVQQCVMTSQLTKVVTRNEPLYFPRLQGSARVSLGQCKCKVNFITKAWKWGWILQFVLTVWIMLHLLERPFKHDLWNFNFCLLFRSLRFNERHVAFE